MKYIKSVIFMIILLLTVSVTANGGSFYLAKDKKFANLVSAIDGKGFGTAVSVGPTKKVGLYYSSVTAGAIESLTVTSAKFQRGNIHLKLGTPNQGVIGWELLSDLSQDASYTVVFRMPKNDHVLVEGATKLNRNNPKWDYYSIKLEKPGLFVIS